MIETTSMDLSLEKNDEAYLYGLDGQSFDIIVDSIMVGKIGIYWKDGKPFNDIIIDEGFRRKGYALESHKQLLEIYDIDKVYSYVNKNNVASLNLHVKMGFKIIGDEDEKFMLLWER